LKYKLWGIGVCFFAIALSLVAPLLEHDTSTRYHQHLEEPGYTPCENHGNDVFCSHLPLIFIETGGVEIPGKTEYSEDGTGYYTAAADGAETISAHMNVVDNGAGYNNHWSDEPSISTAITIHVRGNSSRSFEKSSYSIRLTDENGLNNPQPLLGMDAHHEWVLHGPYLDKSLIRNYMWYNIGGELMGYSPSVRFCEVIIDGEYRGLYVLTERISAGEYGARLNLTVNAKQNIFSGYILQLNGHRPPANNEALAEQFTYYALRIPFQMDIEFPGRQNLTPEITNAIGKDFSDFEKSLYSYDYDDKKYGYAERINTESFIDYFLINEFTCNYDAGWLSTFIYKDTSGKYNMCLWDMNSACDNYYSSQTEPMTFQMQNCPWYVMLLKDENFTSALVDRYRELRKTYFSDEYLTQYVDGVVEWLGPAVDRNFEVWGYTFDGYKPLQPISRNPKNYEDAVQQIKDFCVKRGAWMDENIETLKQYSAESKVKKFNENAN